MKLLLFIKQYKIILKLNFTMYILIKNINHLELTHFNFNKNLMKLLY